ncbi:MAG: hypothetical protein EON59_03135 [Alphaproteobacteria bacterium]|nr:MAG: hypothetical protein EON59_03135 [Alphaproteobacteria bacterium]
MPPVSGGYCEPYLHLFDEDKPVPASKVTLHTKRRLAQVQRAISAGRGQGRGERYQPWIRISRRFSSPVSNMVCASLTVHLRSHHLLSKLEHHTALQLAYMGGTELRECLPMWPTPHPHPWRDEPDDVPGLLEIADAAGIDHGVFLGTTVPYVGSLDMLLEVPWRGRVMYVGVSCKPDEVHEASARAQERVELDRRYCESIGAWHVREGGAGFNQTLIKNLEAYKPLRSELVRYRDQACLTDFCGEFDRASASLPVHAAITAAGSRLGLQGDLAGVLWRVGVWLHRIDIDLSRPTSMLKPIRRGGGQVLAALDERYLGGPK